MCVLEKLLVYFIYCIILSFFLFLEKVLWYYKEENWYYYISINDTILQQIDENITNGPIQSDEMSIE